MHKFKPNLSSDFDHEDIAAAIVRMAAPYRSPYISIIGYSEALLEGISGELNEAQRDDVEAIRISGWEALGHLNDVLDVMLLVSHEIEYEKAPITVKTLIDAVMNDIQRTHHVESSTQIQAVIDTDDDLNIEGDQARLRQVILGLVQNALLTLPQAPIQIQTKRNGDKVEISIRDSCHVQNDDDYSYFFDAGWVSKLENNRWRSMQWQSYLAHHFIHAHNGEIWVSRAEAEDNLPIGTLVSISLPIKLNPDSQ